MGTLTCTCGKPLDYHADFKKQGWICWISCECGKTGHKTRRLRDLWKAKDEAEDIWREKE